MIHLSCMIFEQFPSIQTTFQEPNKKKEEYCDSQRGIICKLFFIFIPHRRNFPPHNVASVADP